MDFNSLIQTTRRRVTAIATMPLTTPVHYYNAGFVFLVIALIALIVFTKTEYLWLVPCVASFLLLCVAYLMEAYQLCKKIWASGISKTVLNSIASVLIVLPSVILAHHAVNNIVGTNPVDFKFSITVLSIIYGVYVIPLLAGILLMLFNLYAMSRMIMNAIFAPFILMKATMLQESGDNTTKMFLKSHIEALRSIAAIILLFIVMFIAGEFESNEPLLRKIGTAVILSSDFYQKTDCANVAKDARISYVENDSIVVATPVDAKIFIWAFEKRTCE